MSAGTGDDDDRALRGGGGTLATDKQPAVTDPGLARPVTTALGHELRTPLNAVTGSAELLLESRLTPLQRRLCAAIYESSEAMLAVVEDLVTLAGREDAGLALPEQSAEFRGVCEEALQLARPLAEQFGVVLLFPAAAAQGSGRVGVDRLRLRNLLVCVLRKAIVLAADGRVVLRLSGDGAGRAGREPERLRLMVEIAGPALRGRLHEAIAARFAEPEAQGVQQVGARSVGFALLHAVVRSVGGTLGLGEQAEEGVLHVVLHLPAAGAQPGQRSTSAPPVPPAPMSGSHGAAGARVRSLADGAGRPEGKAAAPSVLIVDDNQTNRLVAFHLLRIEGCVVLEAVSGLEAIETVAQARPEIVLMDLSMPVMDGAETTRRIRAMEAERGGRPAMIVALTANTLREHEVICRDAGMDGFLTKPIRRKDIAGLLARVAEGPAG
ncbi:MAG: response regulator [Pseudomonadota bacterium]